jgi:hypothetical protein
MSFTEHSSWVVILLAGLTCGTAWAEDKSASPKVANPPVANTYTGTTTVTAGTLTIGNAQPGQIRPVPVLNVQPGATVYSLGGGFGLPGYSMLQMEHVQKELGLTPGQKEKLKEIAKKAAEPMKDEPKIDWAKFRDMKPDEQRKVQKEMADRYAKRAEETRHQVEQVLTKKQIEQLKDMEFRQRASSMLYMPQVLEEIGLSDGQKQQILKIREETQNKMMQLQRESQEKILGVLNPDQTKKLKEFSNKALSGWGEPRERTNRPKGN